MNIRAGLRSGKKCRELFRSAHCLHCSSLIELPKYYINHHSGLYTAVHRNLCNMRPVERNKTLELRDTKITGNIGIVLHNIFVPHDIRRIRKIAHP